ncbi:hypothetical protein NLG97_g2256 [Lecanicillium saksenae]|uniref:Uncharacterized protein n=1 Tax=Lecanicillium saksenae TaxID=468837 RepID=A0ACC1R1D4_9HYPO|nr:hypothetical protein NLG97_g2256 [Lecanicillium saksenae]
MNVLNPADYTVAWIAPLEIEARAALLLLDKRHQGRFALSPGDDYTYEAGEICGHNVIIATLPAGQEYGTAAAAAIASQVKKFFPRLWFGLLVGVAAGLPNLDRDPPRDIRLGDVLVGLAEGNHAGLIPYGLGKEAGGDGFQLLRFGHTLVPTERVIRSAIGSIKINAPDDAEIFLPYYEQFQGKRHSQGSFADPGQELDLLYHIDDQGVEHTMQREVRPKLERTRVWYGPIGSGDTLMKNAFKRNELRDRYNIIGLEMEAAGTMNCIPVGVIRGVCDYGDEHKNKQWQPYAAAMAASYAKALLAQIPPKAEGHITHNCGFLAMDRRAISPSVQGPPAQSLAQSSRGFREDVSGSDEESRDEDQMKALLESLAFDQIDSRLETIEKAYGETCKWLSKTPEYLDWLDPNKGLQHHGFLWIKGHPGSGKSTLMKSAMDSTRKTQKGTYISFFFNARGEKLERSTVGMYRSLLLQLLEEIPSLQTLLKSLGRRTRDRNIKVPQWSLGLLKSLFGKAVQSLEHITLICFVDALDECNESEIRDMVAFFQTLGETAVSTGVYFRVCVSSRHYPHITISKGLGLDIGQQGGHHQDIVNYVSGRLKVGSGKLAEQVCVQLIKKASGVFLWVVLVVRILTDDFDHGHAHMLLRRLEEIPEDIHELFRDILTRDGRHNKELLLCIQWVLFARGSLLPAELYTAILLGIDPIAASSQECNEVEDANIRRFILSSSKGLVELSKSKLAHPQFIHESVREFFLTGSLTRIWPEIGGNFQAESHERLKIFCLDYIAVIATRHGGELSSESSTQSAQGPPLDKTCPLLRYALRNIFYHADQAASQGIGQSDFFQKFDLASWLKLEKAIREQTAYGHSPTTSLLYILAEHNAANLIQSHPNKLDVFEIEEGHSRYGIPILAAMANGGRKSVYTLLKAQADVEPPNSPLHDLCEQYSQTVTASSLRMTDWVEFPVAKEKSRFLNLVATGDHLLITFVTASPRLTRNFNMKGTEVEMQLLEAAKRRRKNIVQLLINMGANINGVDHIGQTLLHLAAERGDETFAQQLLERGANIEAKSSAGWTPLYAATSYRAVVTVRLLLANGADLEAVTVDGETALHEAARRGHGPILLLLLDRGANIEAKSASGETPLHTAAKHRGKISVKVLLDRGANIEATTNSGETPLHLAVVWGSKDALRILLNRGANVDAATAAGETALHLAVNHWRASLLQFLLDKGANVEGANKCGQTAMDLAVQYGYKAAALVLFDRGARREAPRQGSRTP